MDAAILKDTIHQLFSGNKGLLAMDESIGTCNKRFAAEGIPPTIEMRRKYRDLIVSTPGLNESIGGAILYDETFRQITNESVSMPDALIRNRIIPGIKVDMGTISLPAFPNEKITEGLDGLTERLIEYKKMGARFAKWRAVITIGAGIPTITCINANTENLARYAAICQQLEIVPIVEPEVLMDGDHSIDDCYRATELTLTTLFNQLVQFRVDLESIILKPNMVIAGTNAATKNSVHDVANMTLKCLLSAVPPAVPAIAFLSGGQSPADAAAHLKAMHSLSKQELPWILSFSFARAIQQPALQAWKGQDENIAKAQLLLYNSAKQVALAVLG